MARYEMDRGGGLDDRRPRSAAMPRRFAPWPTRWLPRRRRRGRPSGSGQPGLAAEIDRFRLVHARLVDAMADAVTALCGGLDLAVRSERDTELAAASALGSVAGTLARRVVRRGAVVSRARPTGADGRPGSATSGSAALPLPPGDAGAAAGGRGRSCAGRPTRRTPPAVLRGRLATALPLVWTGSAAEAAVQESTELARRCSSVLLHLPAAATALERHAAVLEHTQHAVGRLQREWDRDGRAAPPDRCGRAPPAGHRSRRGHDCSSASPRSTRQRLVRLSRQHAALRSGPGPVGHPGGRRARSPRRRGSAVGHRSDANGAARQADPRASPGQRSGCRGRHQASRGCRRRGHPATAHCRRPLQVVPARRRCRTSCAPSQRAAASPAMPRPSSRRSVSTASAVSCSHSAARARRSGSTRRGRRSGHSACSC